MPPGGPAGEHVNAFRFDDRYLFKHYFDGEEVFDRLKPFYDAQEYRFDVPAHRFEPMQVFLGEHGYDLREVEEPETYVVAVKKYTDHPEGIFKNAVFQWYGEDHHCFLLRDQRAVAEAVREGALWLPETAITVTFG